MTLGNLVMLAYGLDVNQFSAPDWLGDPRLLFDLNAKVPPSTTKEQFSLMFQNLLLDRFKMAVHREVKETQQYELVVAKNGPKFNAAAPAGSPVDASALQKHGCPAVATGFAVQNGQYVLHIPDWSMAVFSTQLAYLLHTHVRDATGLTGNYDIAVCWVPEGSPGAPASRIASPQPRTPARPFSRLCRISSDCGWNRKKGRLRLLLWSTPRNFPPRIDGWRLPSHSPTTSKNASAA